jgi:hypothetical protein
MSNETFRNVKSIDEQLSDLKVSGRAVIHDSLFVKELVASNVVYAPVGKTLKEVTLDATLNGTTEVTVAWVHPAVRVVAAELSSETSASISLGNASSGTQLFALASSFPARVSSVYSQSLGSVGSPIEVPVAENDPLYMVADAAASEEVKIKVYYYEV